MLSMLVDCDLGFLRDRRTTTTMIMMISVSTRQPAPARSGTSKLSNAAGLAKTASLLVVAAVVVDNDAVVNGEEVAETVADGELMGSVSTSVAVVGA